VDNSSAWPRAQWPQLLRGAQARSHWDDIKQQDREWQARAQRAQAGAAQAYERLLHLAEAGNSGQPRIVAHFVASTFDGQTFPFDLFDLRALDVPISDDMLVCLDALRWGRADLYTLVPRGRERVLAICEAWGLSWPQ